MASLLVQVHSQSARLDQGPLGLENEVRRRSCVGKVARHLVLVKLRLEIFDVPRCVGQFAVVVLEGLQHRLIV